MSNGLTAPGTPEDQALGEFAARARARLRNAGGPEARYVIANALRNEAIARYEDQNRQAKTSWFQQQAGMKTELWHLHLEGVGARPPGGPPPPERWQRPEGNPAEFKRRVDRLAPVPADERHDELRELRKEGARQRQLVTEDSGIWATQVERVDHMLVRTYRTANQSPQRRLTAERPTTENPARDGQGHGAVGDDTAR